MVFDHQPYLAAEELAAQLRPQVVGGPAGEERR